MVRCEHLLSKIASGEDCLCNTEISTLRQRFEANVQRHVRCGTS